MIIIIIIIVIIIINNNNNNINTYNNIDSSRGLSCSKLLYIMCLIEIKIKLNEFLFPTFNQLTV